MGCSEHCTLEGLYQSAKNNNAKETTKDEIADAKRGLKANEIRSTKKYLSKYLE